MFCTNCGKEFEGNFCSNCGTKSDENPTPKNLNLESSNVSSDSKPKNVSQKSYDVILIKYDKTIKAIESDDLSVSIQKIIGLNVNDSIKLTTNLPIRIGSDLTSINADVLIEKLNNSGGICKKILTNTFKHTSKTILYHPINNYDFKSDELIPRKHKASNSTWGYLLISTIISILIFTYILFSNPEIIKSLTTPSSSNAQPPVYKDKEFYHVGEEISLRGHSIIVNKFKQGFHSSNEYDKPQNSSNEFVVVNITTTNTKSKPFFHRKKNQSDEKDSLPVNMFGFELEDDSGVKRNPTIVVGMENIMETVNLQPGGKVNGNIAFEAQKGSETLILHYSGNYKSGGAKIKLK
jgi:hypothetical protein